jgi:hypothetical protein
VTAFASPADAVPELSKLMDAREWTALAACYDAEPGTLTAAFFFDPDASGHPAGFDRWRHPFPPGWRYLSHTVEGDVAVVTMGIEINEGDGMIQRGYREFRMRRTSAGWQVLAK